MVECGIWNGCSEFLSLQQDIMQVISSRVDENNSFLSLVTVNGPGVPLTGSIIPNERPSLDVNIPMESIA